MTHLTPAEGGAEEKQIGTRARNESTLYETGCEPLNLRAPDGGTTIS